MHRLPLLLVATLLGVSVLAAPPAAAATGRYVALGDSYAAGLGLTPADPAANGTACGRSTTNYPHQMAAALGLTLVDVTCSGAVISNLAGTQSTGGVTVPPQFDALTADTRLVSLTIGGNDLGFSKIAQFCASLSGPDGPVQGDNQADCRSHYDTDGTDTLAAKLDDSVRPALTAALTEIRTRAPNASVMVVDYPAIVPDAASTPSAGCWSSPLQDADSLPFTTTDLPYLQQTQARLNQLLQQVAGTVGASSATDYADSLAHTACGTTPWVNGVRLDGFSVAPSSLHPTAVGVRAEAATVTELARGLLDGGGPTSGPLIAIPGDSGAGVPTWVWVVIAVGVVLVLVVGLGAFRVVRRRRA